MKFIYVVDGEETLALNIKNVRSIVVSGDKFDVYLSGKTYFSVGLGKNSELLFADLDEVIEYINK
jgi:hypothetical protein